MKGKKLLALVTAGAMCAVALTGCGGNPGASSGAAGSTAADTSAGGVPSDKNVSINIFQFKVEAKDAFQKAIDAYQKKHPNVKINMETVGGGDDYGAALKTKMKSDPPVIFNIGGPQDVKDWNSKLEDLSDQQWISHLPEDSLADVKDGSKVLGMPFDLEGYGIVINRKMFEDAGVSYDSMLTFDGMKKGFDTLKAKIEKGDMKSKYPQLEAVMEYPAKETWVIGDHDINPALGQDFKNAAEAFNAKELPFKAADGYKKMIDFQASYTTNAKNRGTLNSIDYSTSLEGGLAIERVAAIEQGNWIAPSVTNVDANVLQKLDVLPLPVPGFSDGKWPVGVPMYWAVNKDADADKKAAAKDFLNFMYQSDEGKQIIINDAKFAVAFDNYGSLKPSNPLNQRIMKAVEEKKTIPGWVYNGAPATWTQKVAGANVQKYLSGEETWDQVVKNCKDQWKSMRAS
ncbi:ABC transporter substrate-binding protein [Caproicibacterium lactatifermentans]|jgi:raffinose/stachyose/melibiose transport system substrate-binding protein|uniref:ABC transporter substrate-binding protein n=1 Tax=Caproicibacterium lactatifermentans TaxID=2666138 RepID=UPI003D8C4541